MKHLDLFSGIGGFSLAALSVWGAEYENVGFCEIDRYCQELLKIRFPGSVIYDDIKTLTVDKLVNQCCDVENKSQEAFMGARRKDYDEAKIQAHHSDYNKPLDVWHKVNKPIARVEVAPEEPVLSVKVDLLTGGFPR